MADRILMSDKWAREITHSGNVARTFADSKVLTLSCRVSKTGLRVWSVKVQKEDGTRPLVGLGRFDPGHPDHLSTDEARAAARAEKSVTTPRPQKKGRKPRRGPIPTLALASIGEDALKWKVAVGDWGSESLRVNKSALRAHIVPAFGDRRPVEITFAEWKRFLQRMENSTGPVGAVRTTASAIYEYCIEEEVGGIEDSPLVGIKIKSRRKRTSAKSIGYLHPEDLGEFWTATASLKAERRDMLRLVLLTGQRHKFEVAAMRWEDIDLDGRMWRYGHHKNETKFSENVGRSDSAHYVPLSYAVVGILRGLGPKAEGYVFPGRGDSETGHFAGWANLGARVRDFLPGFKVKHLRKTFATLSVRPTEADAMPGDAIGAGVDHQIASMLMGHSEKSTRFAHYEADPEGYLRGERIRSMDAWADYVLGLVREQGGIALVA